VIGREYIRDLLPRYRASRLKVRLLRENPLRAVNIGVLIREICHSYPRQLIDTHLLRMIGTADPAHHHYRIGPFRWAPAGGVISVSLKLKKNRWWKFYAYLFGVPVFAFALPRRLRSAA